MAIKIANIGYILLFITFSANASFKLVEDGDELSAYYIDSERIIDLKNQLITPKDYTQEVLTKFIEEVNSRLECSRVGTDNNLPSCNEEQIQRYQYIHLGIPDPTNCQDSLCRIFEEAYDILSQEIHSEEHQGRFNLEIYGLTPLSLPAQSTNENLSSALNSLKLYLQDGTPSHLSCTAVLLNENEYDEASGWDLSNYNREECDRETKEISSLTYGINLNESFFDGNQVEIGPIPRVDESYLQIIKSYLNQREITNLIFGSFMRKVLKGQQVDHKIKSFQDRLAFVLRETLYQQEAIETTLQILSSPISGVTYNGTTGFHDYQNMHLAKTVFDLAISIGKDPKKFASVVSRLGLQALFVDTNTSSGASRIEPIDLVSNMMYRVKKWEMRYYFNDKIPASYKDFLKKHVLNLLSLSEQPEVVIMLRQPDDENPSFTCSVKDPLQIHEYFENSDIYYLSVFDYEIEFEFDQTDFTFNCGKIPYRLHVQIKKDSPLLPPKPSRIDDGYVDLLMPFGMVREINDDFKSMAKMYFKMMGFSIEITPEVDTKQEILAELVATDVFIPVGHALASRSMDVGTKKSEKWTITREAEEGDIYGIRFNILLSLKSTPESAIISSAQFTQAYKNRIATEDNPLLVFIQTCEGENNLPIWSLIYRNALRDSTEDRGNFPHVIASTRGFDTNSNIAIAGNILYPTDLAEILAKGETPDDLNNFFKGRDYGMFTEELILKFVDRGLPEIVVRQTIKTMFKDKDVMVSNFEPTYNFSEENRELTIRSSGIQYLLMRNGDEVVMDETY